MTYVVTAPLVVVFDPDGRAHHCYEGSTVEIGDANHAAYLLAEGLIVVAGQRSGKPTDDGAVGDTATDPNHDEPGSDKPPFVAAKAKWIDYAVSQGFARDEAEAMTKDQLISALK